MAGQKVKVLILGAGFGGLYTALAASRTIPVHAEITLVDRNDYFLFTPLMFQAVSGTLQTSHIARPLVRLLPRRIRFLQATVHHVDFAGRRVETDAGTLSYDFLVLALGGVPNYYGMASAERHALPFKWLPDLFRLRAHIEQRFAEAERIPHRAPDLLRTVVAGAGCTGVELVAELHDWFHGPLLRQFPRVAGSAVALVLAEALDHLLCPMDPRLMRAAVRKLLERDVDVRVGTYVLEVGPDSLRVREASGREALIPCGTVVWTAGIKGNPVTSTLPVAFGPGERIQVTGTLQVPGHPEVLAIGDLAVGPDPHGGVLPATAQVAVQQGPAAARVLRALLAKREPELFRFKRRGEVLGLGRMGALAEVFGFRLMGLPAWLVARTVHLARLPDWGDRVAVAWQWAKSLLEAERR